MLLHIIMILIVSSNGVCRKENMYWDLFRQGKSFLSRSFGYPSMNVPRPYNFIAQRGGHYYGLELFDNSVRNGDEHEHHHPDQDEELYQYNQNDYPAPAPLADKEKNDFKIISHTDIIENDNLDLYQFIGGISFASLLAATILILGRNRRNNTLTKSLEEISRSSGLPDRYSNNLSGEEIFARLLSQQLKLSLRKLSRKNQRHSVSVLK